MVRAIRTTTLSALLSIPVVFVEISNNVLGTTHSKDSAVAFHWRGFEVTEIPLKGARKLRDLLTFAVTAADSTTDVSNQAVRNRSGGSTLKWLVLVGLFWSQATLALHESNEHAGDLHGSCVICMHLERDGDDTVMSVNVPMVRADTNDTLIVLGIDIAGSVEIYSCTYARAPPSS